MDCTLYTYIHIVYTRLESQFCQSEKPEVGGIKPEVGGKPLPLNRHFGISIRNTEETA